MHWWRRRWMYWHAALDAIDDLRWEIRLRERRAMSAGRLPQADPPGTVPALRPEHHEHAELVLGAPLAPKRPGVHYASDPTTGAPIVDMSYLVKQSMTKKVRTDVSRAMIRMCSLGGWQSSTLNPDMGNAEKLTIVTTRYSKIMAVDDPEEMYAELIALSATTLGWAQSITRSERRSRRRLRKAAKAAKAARAKAKTVKDKTVGDKAK